MCTEITVSLEQYNRCTSMYQSVVNKAVENDSFLYFDYYFIMGYIYDLSASCEDSFSNIWTKYSLCDIICAEIANYGTET